MKVLAVKLEKWRNERTPGQMSEASPYVTGASTILSWWQSVIIGTACMVILPFVAEYILPETLHMMDVKEEVELMSSAASMLRFIGNAPFAPELIPGMVEAIEKISTERRQWHHRLRIMMVIQVFYYRQLFVLSKSDRKRLFDVVIVLLNDTQLEVREAASATLSGMVHCTKFDEKNLVLPLLERFKTGLIMNPMPKKRASGVPGGSGISTPQLNGINTRWTRQSPTTQQRRRNIDSTSRGGPWIISDYYCLPLRGPGMDAINFGIPREQGKRRSRHD